MELPFVLSIPHCADRVPPDIKSCMALSEDEVTQSVDFGTREIFAGLSARRIIAAEWSRLVVDLNRSPTQYDAKGVVASTDYRGQTVFRDGCEPSRAEIDARVARYHLPYHRQLSDALKPEDFLGLIDCHSLEGTGPADAPDRGQLRRDVILSNFGDTSGNSRSAHEPLTCPADVLHLAAAAFERQGFSVALNHPYQGGYIVRHYGAFLRTRGRFAVQIEINQDLFMMRPSGTPDPQRLTDASRRVAGALDHWAQALRGSGYPQDL